MDSEVNEPLVEEKQQFYEAEGELLKLTSAVTQVMSDVESVMTVENYEGIYACPDHFVQLLSTSIYDMATLPALPAFTAENITRAGSAL